MANKFVNYLNTMTNASSDNRNAIAESQVTNEFYKKIRVERQIGNTLYDYFFKKEHNYTVILTGHAGDGKTSILNQVLYRIDYFKTNTNLKSEDIYDDKFYYIKDMSELDKVKQAELMLKALNNRDKGISSLVITNTGPLINTVKRLTKSLSAETEILNGIKKDGINKIELEINNKKYEIRIVNIANIDNIYFVEEFINNIISEELWQDCNNCEVKEYCPIKFNFDIIKNNSQNLTSMIQNIYLYLKEKDVRLTIRQMVSHLSYSITGALQCKDISKGQKEIFKYAFPNLFFGYEGLARSEVNLKAINSLYKLDFCKKPIEKIDHDLYIKKNTRSFNRELNDLLNSVIHLKMDNLEENNLESIALRRSIRRFYILLKTKRESKTFKEVFGKSYDLYLNLLFNENITYDKKIVYNDILYRALYKLFVGIFPNKKTKELYITLKKEYNNFENVQMILGRIDKEEISIKQKEMKSIDKNFIKYKPYIDIDRIENISIKFTDFDFLFNINRGLVITDFEKIQDQRITYIKTLILNNPLYKTDDFRLLRFTNNGIENNKIVIKENKIYVE